MVDRITDKDMHSLVNPSDSYDNFHASQDTQAYRTVQISNVLLDASLARITKGIVYG